MTLRHLLLLGTALWLPTRAAADATIAVDGNLADWPSPGFTFTDAEGEYPPPFSDIAQVRVTNDNTAGSDGNLYIGVSFYDAFTPNIGVNDVDVWVFLDIDGDGQINGPLDRRIELTDGGAAGGVFDGDGNWLGDIGAMAYAGAAMEAAIPYSLLGLTHGADTFGIAFSTTGHPNKVEYSPEPGAGDDGFIIYDGTVGDDVEPLSVRLLHLQAIAGEDRVEIAWATASERQNAGFRLQRHIQGMGWADLQQGLIPGLGDAAVGQRYRWLDGAGREGDRYRLIDVEFGGREHLHPPVIAATDPDTGDALHPAAPVGAAARPVARSLRGDVRKLAIREHALHALDAHASDLGPGAVQLSVDGLPVPLLETAGGRYVVGAPARDRYADFSVVTLRRGGGRPMAQERVHATCDVPARTAQAQVEAGSDRLYYVAAKGADPFYAAMAWGGQGALLVLDAEAAVAAPGRLRAVVAGVAGDAGTLHAAELWLNGARVGVQTWFGRADATLDFALPAGVVVDGSNLVELRLADPAQPDLLYVDRVTLDYQRTLRLVGHDLRFAVDGDACLQLDVGPTSPMVVLDVTDPARPVHLSGWSVAADGALRLARRASGLHRYWLVPLSAARAPELLGDLEPAPSSLAGVDSLIVTHAALAEAAEALATLHRGRGLGAAILDVERIYDAESGGRPGAEPLRRYLARALRTWQPAPRFVTLIGSASVDGAGVSGLGGPDLVPTLFRQASHGYEAAFDGGFVAADDGLSPLAAIGRIPADTLAQALAAVRKSALLDARPRSGAPRVLLVADRRNAVDDPAGPSYLQRVGALRAACVPAEASVRVFDVTSTPGPRAALRTALGSGVDVVGFVGHAFVSGWSSPTLFNLSDLAALPTSEPFALLSWTCFDGAFAGPWAQSLAARAVLREDAGAAVAIASSSLADPDAVTLLGEQTLCRALGEPAATLGQALAQAKRDLVGTRPAVDDAVAGQNLLGDPALGRWW